MGILDRITKGGSRLTALEDAVLLTWDDGLTEDARGTKCAGPRSKMTDFRFHLGLDPRLGRRLAVVRFNLFAADESHVDSPPCVDALVDLLLRRFEPSLFQVFVDLHEGAMPALSSDQWPGPEPGVGVESWYQTGNTTAVHLTDASGFRSVRKAAHELVDDVVFFRVRKCSQPISSMDGDATWAIRAIPDRSESDYVELLPLFHAVGSLGCGSCFMSVMSRSDMLDELATSAVESLGARPSGQVRGHHA